MTSFSDFQVGDILRFRTNGEISDTPREHFVNRFADAMRREREKEQRERAAAALQAELERPLIPKAERLKEYR